ncbi:DNA starvation/stationary phase protection protein Dps [Deinococcus misasensis]|uniref:DNA starvation/stationary phase protection protein Dps n=1 Tax=Deinococcus misasensis TaxID=392413 RepID=UPI000558E998|nr:DNA starvation/stationary phase protection protein Dps [Deinococcus misasensis]
MENRTFHTRLDLNSETRHAMTDRLNQLVADLFDLYSQVKQAHWNLKGMQFIAVHELLDQHAAELLTFIDELAERASTLGGYALGTVRQSAKSTRLPELSVQLTDVRSYISALSDAYAVAARCARENINDADEKGDKVTADLFTEVSTALDKRLWFLEAHLQS